MARKVTQEESYVQESGVTEPEFNEPSTEGEGTDVLDEMDFNVEDEFKPDPLLFKNVYHAVSTKVVFEAKNYSIVWDFCLHDNDGVMTDGVSPVDGVHVYFRNWLPRPGDENLTTASGRANKRQSKINMMKQFSDMLEIDMNTKGSIITALSEGQWIGIEVDVDVDIEEYQGRPRNVVNRVRRSSLY
jgi:hypothetical protein